MRRQGIYVKEFVQGQPITAPIAVRILGEDLGTLDMSSLLGGTNGVGLDPAMAKEIEKAMKQLSGGQ